MTLRYSASRILIRCPNWIGDMVAATAALRCMRRNYPEAHITLLLEPYARPVVENAPWFDEIEEFHKGHARVAESIRIACHLREKPRYDLALLLTHSFNSALISRAGAAKVRVGHARSHRSWLLTDPVPWPKSGRDWWKIGKVSVYSSLLEYLGCEGADEQHPEVFTSEQEETETEAILESHGWDRAKPLLAIVPGAAFGSSKLWEPKRFAQVADHFANQHNMQTLLLTGPAEADIGRAIEEVMATRPIRFGPGETHFGHLKSLIRRSALMVCNDTGPRHLGIAYNLPVVTLMGPTDPAVTESDYAKTIVVRQDVPCAPCYKRKCPRGDHICMKAIKAEMVIEAAESLLKQYRPSGDPG
jgi:lipopolysaccharide heptosyltransferase II